MSASYCMSMQILLSKGVPLLSSGFQLKIVQRLFRLQKTKLKIMCSRTSILHLSHNVSKEHFINLYFCLKLHRIQIKEEVQSNQLGF
jgi:hypothetical protein